MVLSNLASIRTRKEWTQEKLAAEAGVSFMTIRRAEKGKGVILNNAKAIAKALRVSMTELTESAA